MNALKTPWGPVEVSDLIPHNFGCVQCGRCCSGFVLSMRPSDIEIWYKRFLSGSPYEYPNDIGAIYHLFVEIQDAFSADGQQIYTCRAFDRVKKTCMIFEDAPGLRPVACWAFPYNYDFAGLSDFPYPFCSIFQKTLKRVFDNYFSAIQNTYHPLSRLAVD